MTTLIVLNHKPYDGTDVTWNALRLAGQLREDGSGVRVFLMNESVELAREGLAPGPDFDLQRMLLDAVAAGAEVKLCKTCIGRCGLKDARMVPAVRIGTMPELSEWVRTSDRVLTF